MRNGMTCIIFYPTYFQDTLHQQHNSTAVVKPCHSLINWADVSRMERESWLKRQMLTVPHYCCKFPGTHGRQKPRSEGLWILEVLPLKTRHWQKREYGNLKKLQGDWQTSLYSLALPTVFPAFPHHTCFLWECPGRVSYSNCFLENAHARWHHQSWNIWVLKGSNEYNTTTWGDHIQKYLTAW